jgi:glycosyltransferase involved in cell wall biosynthesis
LRILVLAPTFLPVIGGAEIVLYEVFRRLSDIHEIRLVTPYLPQSLISQYATRNEDYPFDFQVVRYHDKWTMMKIRGHRVFKGLIPPFSLSAVSALRKQVKSFRPDLINVHFTMPTGLAGFIANTFWDIPSVLTLNGRDVPGPGVPWLWKHWHRIIARGYADTTYVSDYCQKIVFGQNDTGTITWNGVDFNRITGGNPQKIIDGFQLKNKKILFSLQRLSKEKNVGLILQALSKVIAKDREVVLLLAGTRPRRKLSKAALS